MKKEELSTAIYNLKGDFQWGYLRITKLYKDLELVYIGLRENGYSDEKINDFVDSLQLLAKDEHEAWKASDNLIDSILNK